MGNIAVGMQGVVDADINRINLMPMLGGLELTIGVAGRTSLPDPSYWVTPYAGELHVTGAKGQGRLGVARPGLPLRDRTTSPSAGYIGWELRLPLLAHQLEAIEEVRDGGDLLFKLVLEGEGGPLSDLTRVERLHADLHFPLAQSSWVRQLGEAKAMDVLLLEVAMPFVDPPPAGRAILASLRKAQELYAQGHYTQCVGSCRAAMDALKKHLGRSEDWKTRPTARGAIPARRR